MRKPNTIWFGSTHGVNQSDSIASIMDPSSGKDPSKAFVYVSIEESGLSVKKMRQLAKWLLKAADYMEFVQPKENGLVKTRSAKEDVFNASQGIQAGEERLQKRLR